MYKNKLLWISLLIEISLLIVLLHTSLIAIVIKSDQAYEWAKENSKFPFTFVVIGDTRPIGPGMELPVELLQRMFHEIALIKPDFVVNVGDIVFGYRESYEQVRDALQKLLDIYEQECGDIPLSWQFPEITMCKPVPKLLKPSLKFLVKSCIITSSTAASISSRSTRIFQTQKR